jgi:hypothetical protein
MNGIQLLPLGRVHWDHAGPSDWAGVLATFPLFSGLPRRRLRRLVRNAPVAEYGPGDMVTQKGTSGDSLYLILGGSAKALREPVSRSLRIGDYFGELSLLDGTSRSATVIATSELHLMKLPARPSSSSHAPRGLTADATCTRLADPPTRGPASPALVQQPTEERT